MVYMVSPLSWPSQQPCETNEAERGEKMKLREIGPKVTQEGSWLSGDLNLGLPGLPNHYTTLTLLLHCPFKIATGIADIWL